MSRAQYSSSSEQNYRVEIERLLYLELAEQLAIYGLRFLAALDSLFARGKGFLKLALLEAHVFA